MIEGTVNLPRTNVNIELVQFENCPHLREFQLLDPHVDRAPVCVVLRLPHISDFLDPLSGLRRDLMDIHQLRTQFVTLLPP